MAVFALGKSSPKRNRLDQCLLGLEVSQKWVFFEGVLWLKALILKALNVSYAASQALTPGTRHSAGRIQSQAGG